MATEVSVEAETTQEVGAINPSHQEALASEDGATVAAVTVEVGVSKAQGLDASPEVLSSPRLLCQLRGLANRYS